MVFKACYKACKFSKLHGWNGWATIEVCSFWLSVVYKFSITRHSFIS